MANWRNIPRELLDASFKWDVLTWKNALHLWDPAVEQLKKEEQVIAGLELGSDNGGMSLLLNKVYALPMTCSDVADPTPNASKLHQKFQTAEISYATIDGLDIAYPDNSFDLIVFKSVLGFVRTLDKQQQMINEINRVLKPGGVLLFAENLKGSALHQWARKTFVPWGGKWRYVTTRDMNTLLGNFSEVKISTDGFLTAFSKSKAIYQLLYTIDRLFCKLLPKNSRYVVYGYAQK